MRKFVALCWVLFGCEFRHPTPATCPPSIAKPTDVGKGAQLSVEGLEVRLVIPAPFVFATCVPPTAEVELSAPDGSIVPETELELEILSDRSEAEVRFTPSQAGLWLMRVRWSTGDGAQRTVLVAPLVNAGPSVLRRFVDRMDTCERGPFRLNSGSMACQRTGGEILVYGADGQLLDHFPGEQLAVRADELWSWTNGSLEHRTGLPGMLRFDGSVPLLTRGAEGVTQPGLAIRGGTSSVIEVRWDGTSLTSTTIAEGYPIIDPVVITQGMGETWNTIGCRIQRGCPLTECSPTYICPDPRLGDALSIEQERIWSLFRLDTGDGRSIARITATPRPLDTIRPPPGFVDLFFETGISRNPQVPTVERPRLGSGLFLFFPYQRTPDTIDFVAVEDPGLTITVTAEWMVSRGGDPFTLLSTQTPSIP